MMIPIQAEYYALEGLGQLLETVEMVKKHLNQRLVVSTILVTMYDGRTRLASGVAEEVREHFARPGPEEHHPALGPGLRGAVVRPDRDDLRSRLAGGAVLPRSRPRDRRQGSPAVNAPSKTPQRRGLGRGLGSLIPTAAPAEDTPDADVPSRAGRAVLP